MGNSTILMVVILLLVVSVIGLVFRTVWLHQKAQTVFFSGVLFLVTYLIVQVLAWKDLSEVQSTDSVVPFWGMAGFENVFYDATAWIGFVLIAVGGILCSAKSRKAKKSTGVAT